MYATDVDRRQTAPLLNGPGLGGGGIIIIIIIIIANVLALDGTDWVSYPFVSFFSNFFLLKSLGSISTEGINK